jgi:hypothetical protein
MNVTANSLLLTKTGLRVSPVRWVRAECLTNLPNCRALVLREIFSMGGTD